MKKLTIALIIFMLIITIGLFGCKEKDQLADTNTNNNENQNNETVAITDDEIKTILLNGANTTNEYNGSFFVESLGFTSSENYNRFFTEIQNYNSIEKSYYGYEESSMASKSPVNYVKRSSVDYTKNIVMQEDGNFYCYRDSFDGSDLFKAKYSVGTDFFDITMSDFHKSIYDEFDFDFSGVIEKIAAENSKLPQNASNPNIYDFSLENNIAKFSAAFYEYDFYNAVMGCSTMEVTVMDGKLYTLKCIEYNYIEGIKNEKSNITKIYSYNFNGKYPVSAPFGANLYIASDNTVEITLSNTNSTYEDNSIISGIYNSALTIETPEKGGYEFVGWYSDKELTIPFTGSVYPSKNITVYAKWNLLDTYFELSYGGDFVYCGSSAYQVGSPLDALLVNVVDDGMTFDGLYEDSNFTQIFNGGDYVTAVMPARNVTLYIKLIKIYDLTQGSWSNQSGTIYTFSGTNVSVVSDGITTIGTMNLYESFSIKITYEDNNQEIISFNYSILTAKYSFYSENHSVYFTKE